MRKHYHLNGWIHTENCLIPTQKPEQLYKLNVIYCKELYVVLGALEVAVRNSFHQQISKYQGKEDWFVLDLLLSKHAEQVNKSIEHLVRTKKGNYIIDDLIAQLNYGFWVHLCNRPYEKTLWNTALYKCFPFFGQKPDRDEIRKRLLATLTLRNKIAHLEPIIKKRGHTYTGIP